MNCMELAAEGIFENPGWIGYALGLKRNIIRVVADN